jgi:Grx4 family monothiol glutaredoxin
MQCSIITNVQASAAIAMPRSSVAITKSINATHRVMPAFLNFNSFATRPSAVAAEAAHKSTIICAAAASLSFEDTPAIPITDPLPGTSGVYAVYDPQGNLQFVGVSRKVAVSVATHIDALPELVGSVKVMEMPNSSKDELTEAWKEWIQEAVNSIGAIPPGNAPGEKKWQQRRARAAKPEIRLTSGKGIEDLTCTVEFLIEQIVKSNKVVIFLKGTRTEPACGFSHKALTILSEVAGQEFEVVNVLDEIYNPGVRDAIKNYTQWPTIPQVFVKGEFVGGSDILEQMHNNGELKQMLHN